ncbi:MAG TPA: hypothetical protein VH062_01160 [Polyangiaceae bacterium]|jgi:hypothetical protein|nr:hypothetical protein [Polyangiaceae bacterium]
MSRHYWVLAFAFFGCSSNSKSPEPPAGGCVSNAGMVCATELQAFPFVKFAAAGTDFCLGGPGSTCYSSVPPDGASTRKMSQTSPGSLCLSGKVAAGGFALLALVLADKSDDGRKILHAFDAAARGITQVTLTIDSPPSQGATLLAHSVVKTSCPSGPQDCFFPPDFKFNDISQASTVTAPLNAFVSADDATMSLDAGAINDILVRVGPGDYDFCVHDFALLDAQGEPVTP